MFKCKTCGRRFRLLAKNRYEVVRIPTPSKGLWMLDSKPMEEKVYFNAFDCPHCGCQNIMGVVEKNRVDDTTQEEGGVNE